MKHTKKLKLGLGILAFTVILWYFGFFTRFNYLTAKLDIWFGTPRIATYGMPFTCGVPCIGLKEQYGFHESNIGCLVTDVQIRGIEAYNAQIEIYLKKRNGKNWRKKYEAEMDSLIKNDLLE